MTDKKVFIAGSRNISWLNDDIKRRVDNIIDKSLTVIVGDANGADKAIQQYLKNKNYKNVTIFCMEGGCRNNIGGWPTRIIKAANPHRRDFAYYSTKDKAMAAEADYGLMLWDGQSRGTLTNVVNLLQNGIPVVIHTANTFHTLHQLEQLAGMPALFSNRIKMLKMKDQELPE
jgi:hypothetical protein